MAILDRIFGVENRHSSGMVIAGQKPDQHEGATRVFGTWGPNTGSGQVVNEETCNGLSAWYCGTRLLSSTPAALPLCVYRRINEDGDKEPARDNGVYKLLHDRPNPTMTPIQFREVGQTFILLWGRFVAYIERDGIGRPIGLWPMHTREVRRQWKDGHRQYDITRVRDNDMFPRPPSNKPVLFDDEVLDVSTFDGRSVVSYAREQLGEAIAAQAFGAGFYGGGAQPYLALISKKSLSQEAIGKLRDNWSRKHGGTTRNIAVLEDELDVKTIGMPLEDAQFLQSRQFYVTEIARWLGIPPHKLYDLLRSTNNNIEEQQLEWYEDLIPHLVRWEQELHWKLFSPAEHQLYLVGHVVENLLRGNIEKRYQAYSVGLQWGFFNRNEVRRRENLNSMGEDGDTFMVPNNMVPADQLGLVQGGGIGGLPIAGEAGAVVSGGVADAKAGAAAASGQSIQTASELVLNGAQITAATAIVTAVSKGEIPRDAGIGQLTILFNLTNEQAESIMGTAGTSTPTTPNPNPAAQVEPAVKITPEVRSAFQVALARMLHKETLEVRTAAKEPDKFLDWLERFYKGWSVKLTAGLVPAGDVCRSLGVEVDVAAFSGAHCERSHAALLELSGQLTATEFAEQIGKEMNKWEATLPEQLTTNLFQENR